MAWNDPTEANLVTLSPALVPLAVALVNGCRDAGWPVYISSARRSIDEQQRLVGIGRSQTLRSKHLEGLAFDIDVLGLSRDQIPKAFWNALGPAAEQYLGLKWGGRWETLYDPGHFEL
jgi:uncharacterized protein YcbK (DUF882 family)